jgi:ATP-dependent helicase HrpA
MCRAEYLNWLRLREWQDIHAQLRRLSKELGLRVNRTPASPADIHRALLAGLLSHVGSKDPDSFEYRGARGARFSINPGSVLFKRSPQWVMAGELVETSRTWGRYLAPVDPEVVEAVGAHLLKRTVSDPWWDPASGHAVANETVTMLGMTLAGERRVVASRFDPAAARELFIRHALVHGEWESPHEFVVRNQATLNEVRALEARGRADMLVDEDTMVRFFDARIPTDIVSVRHFDRWWRTSRDQHPHLLDFTVDDLVAADAADVDDDLFPAQWRYGDTALGLSYEFDPSSPTDGVTVAIPASLLDRIDPRDFEWNVPGFRGELIAALIRSLPKPIRKRFVPAPETARRLAGRIGPQQGSLIEVLRKELTRLSGSVVLPDDFDFDSVPAHLKPAFVIVDESGRELASGRDLAALREALREGARRATASSTHPLERSGITSWDMGDLPEVVTLRGEGNAVEVYPALIDDGESVSIRLVATREEQLELSAKGMRRRPIRRPRGVDGRLPGGCHRRIGHHACGAGAEPIGF